MGVARILGHTVRVEKKDVRGTMAYYVCGLNAEMLHATCEQNKLPVSPFHDGSFVVLQKDIDHERAFPDSIIRLYICGGLEEAVQERQRA